MPYLTVDELAALARQRAEQLIEHHRTLLGEDVLAAILYGPLPSRAGQIQRNESDATLLEIVRGVPTPAMFDSARLGFRVIEFGSRFQYAIPGVLRIIVADRTQFDEACRNLHPEIVQLLCGYDVLFPRDARNRTRVEVIHHLDRARNELLRLARSGSP